MTTTATKCLRDVLLEQWSGAGRKVSELAEAIPAGAYDFRPVEGVRSTAEVLRHLAFWNDWVAATLAGGKPDGAANEIARAQAPSKARVLAALDQSLAESVKQIERQGEELPAEIAETMLAFLAHTAEHYGQLVVHARMSGVVPPASRG